MRKTPPVTGGTDRGPSVMNMNNRNFVRGLFLIVFALIFGGVATTYPLGTLSRPAPACSRCWSAAASP